MSRRSLSRSPRIATAATCTPRAAGLARTRSSRSSWRSQLATARGEEGEHHRAALGELADVEDLRPRGPRTRAGPRGRPRRGGGDVGVAVQRAERERRGERRQPVARRHPARARPVGAQDVEADVGEHQRPRSPRRATRSARAGARGGAAGARVARGASASASRSPALDPRAAGRTLVGLLSVIVEAEVERAAISLTPSRANAAARPRAPHARRAARPAARAARRARRARSPRAGPPSRRAATAVRSTTVTRPKSRSMRMSESTEHGEARDRGRTRRPARPRRSSGRCAAAPPRGRGRPRAPGGSARRAAR